MRGYFIFHYKLLHVFYMDIRLKGIINNEWEAKRKKKKIHNLCAFLCVCVQCPIYFWNFISTVP